MKWFFCFLLSLACAVTGWGANASIPAVDLSQSLRVRNSALPIFPAGMLAKGITEGWARVVIDVGMDGVPSDSLVVGYSQSEFGDAASRAVRQWKFDPMVVGGRSVASQVAVGFAFEAKGVVMDIMPGFDVMNLWFKGLGAREDYRPKTLAELDGIPIPTVCVPPPFPSDLAKRGVMGSATVEFYIDETGAVRMPAVAKADFPELGDLLAQAIRQWKFEPPTANGRPVLVHASQTVTFGAKLDEE